MFGLVRKDFYLIAGSLRPVVFLGLIPPLFVAAQNTDFLMPILSIIIPLLFAFQVSTTMSLDESAKWRMNTMAMPMHPATEAGSKYILLVSLSLFSAVLVILIGLIATVIDVVSLQEVMMYGILGLFFSAFYGYIVIPASYRYGADNSKYVFMFFAFVPTLVPVILNMLHVSFDLTWLVRISPMILCSIAFAIICVAGIISFEI